MRFESINYIVDREDLSSVQKAILTTLWRFSDESNISHPSIQTIMRCSGISNRDTFYRNKKQLVEMGLLQVETFSGRGCIYKILPNIALSSPDTYPDKVVQNCTKNRINRQQKEININYIGNSSALSYPDENFYKSMDKKTFDYINGAWMYEMSSEFIC